jgi:formylglycine-generating enzyme required for sulfatase activity
MGSPEGEAGRFSDEGPQHWVTLTKGFWMMDVPCTQELWQAVMQGKNPSRFKDDQRPVERVSWNDVQKFIQKLNALAPGPELRLPTEAQWEYACRAGSETALYRIPGTTGELTILGDNDGPELDAIAWYGGNSGVDPKFPNAEDSKSWPQKQYDHSHAATQPVRLKTANMWGLYDMLGNVWEWCADGMRPYSSQPQVDPVGPSVESRAIRGGSWNYIARSVRCAFRRRHSSGIQYDNLGFRLVRVQEGS